MPELAEVETFRIQLKPVLTGQVIESIEVLHPRVARRHENMKSFVDKIKGQRITEISRHGKYLTLVLDSGDQLNLHLRMSGRFVAFKNTDDVENQFPKHTHLLIRTKSYTIAYIDPRTFGEFWLTESQTPEITRGIDAYKSSIKDIAIELENLKNSRRFLKTILLDQHIVSGIGNIYADEICAAARVRPDTPFFELETKEIAKISRSIKNVLDLAVENRGSSLKDESFRDLYGEIGNYQNYHKVHARKYCADCKSEIVKIKVSGRSTYYCPKCQK